MKKVLAVVLASMMVLSLAACGGDDKEETKAPETQAETQAEKDTEAPAETDGAAETQAPAGDEAKGGDVNGDGKIIVGYISKNLTDPFHGPINTHAEETFDALVADGTIDEWTKILDGQTLPDVQINCANDCITKGCDYVFIAPAEAEASDPAVTQMAEAGIKVIVFNSKTKSTDDVAWLFSGSDDVEAGRMLARWVVEKCPDGGKFIHCNGILGNSAQIQRTQGMKEIMESDENKDKFEMVADEDTQWSGEKAATAAENALAQYGDELVAVICDNDDMSSAAQSAVNAAGRTDIVCVGVDGNRTPLEMVKAGELGATVLQNGVGQLQAGIDAMVDDINGKAPASKNVDVPFVLVTADNVDEYLK